MVEVSATVRLEICETEQEVESKSNSIWTSHRVRRAQRDAILPGEDPTSAMYIGRLQGIRAYTESLEVIGVQRAVVPIPRPWDPEQLRRLAGSLRVEG